jgi:hypothetical protein
MSLAWVSAEPAGEWSSSDRGDGTQCAGMPVAQHLRHRTRARRSALDDLTRLGEVLGDLPGVAQALHAGEATVDQAAAIARHAARVGLPLRRALDTELTDQDTWHRWTPEHLATEAGRILASLTPAQSTEREQNAAAREFLHVRATRDGQGLLFKGRFEGLNASLFDAVLADASDTPANHCRSDRPRHRLA